MPWIAYIAHFIAAAFLTNGVPHFVNGVSGRRFRTAFANPSSPTVNVVWGWVNFQDCLPAVCQCRAALYRHAGRYDLRRGRHARRRHPARAVFRKQRVREVTCMMIVTAVVT
ncbi:hypothetical protein JOH51_003268 [Rhizobium leguminosarum]|nr:hypothetical protein [Rhizobium leguminosarum]